MGKSGAVKNIILFLIILFIYNQSISANPIMLFYFNELMFDSTGWKIELHQSYYRGPLLLDGWYMATLTDTAYFKNGILLDSNYLVITAESMTVPLYINPDGDQLTLYSTLHFEGQINFGGVNVSYISAPKLGQSICLWESRNSESQEYFYYLDNTPTLGGPNDTINARGTVQGEVTDLFGDPLDSVRVIYDRSFYLGYYHDIYVLTDSIGQFVFRDYASNKRLIFEKENYQKDTLFVQLWPDSIANISVVKLITGIDEESPLHPLSFSLEQSYPNPFNPTTTVSFVIGHVSFVILRVFSVLGEEVATLVNERKQAGEYRVTWNAEGVTSGVYFYRIVAGDFVETKKMVVVK